MGQDKDDLKSKSRKYSGFLTPQMSERVNVYIEYCKKLNLFLSPKETEHKKEFAEFVYITDSRTQITKDDLESEYQYNDALDYLLRKANAEIVDLPKEIENIIANIKGKSLYIESLKKIFTDLDISITTQTKFTSKDFLGFEVNNIFTPSVLRLLVALKENTAADSLKIQNVVLNKKRFYFLIKVSGRRPIENAEKFILGLLKKSERKFKRTLTLVVPLSFVTGEGYE